MYRGIIVGHEYSGQCSCIDERQYFGRLVREGIKQFDITLILQATCIDQLLAHFSNVVHDILAPAAGSRPDLA